jgi:hypothetical protein
MLKVRSHWNNFSRAQTTVSGALNFLVQHGVPCDEAGDWSGPRAKIARGLVRSSNAAKVNSGGELLQPEAVNFTLFGNELRQMNSDERRRQECPHSEGRPFQDAAHALN